MNDSLHGFDFVELMRYVVQATSDAAICKVKEKVGAERSGDYKMVQYLYGRVKEINDELNSMQGITAETRLERLPLIALVEPVTITQPRDGSYVFVSGFDIIICTATDSNVNSFQRQKDNVIPVLYPIYEEFMRQLAKSKFIVSPNPKKDLAHSVKIHKGTKFYNDLIDAIEITDLQLKLKLSNC